jgi:NAD(P)-dependent dehydrogenase (short-subunit alcohol dehydrogenase family)
MNSPTSTLAGRRIAITGAARGIGLATARELAARGAHVTIGDLDLALAQEAAAGIPGTVTGFALDVSDQASFAAFLADAKKVLGGLDVLVNNAGIMPIGPYLDLALPLARRALEINVLGVMTGTQLALPDMIAQGSGHIINLSSSAGKASVPGGLAYCATKAAVVSFTEGARLEFGDRGVKFTCVMPSFTNTDLIAGTQGTRLLKNVEPEDVAGGIADAIERPVADVYRPKALRGIFFTQPLLGRRLRDAMNRRLGAYETFLAIDHSQRDGYDQRISHS